MPRPFIILAITIILSCAPAALAQSPQGTEHRLEPIDVTSTKTALDKRLVPFSAYSVTNEDYKEKPSGYYNTVGEMIRDVPGVHVGEFFPWGMSWIQLRGTGNGVNRTVQMVDGLPVYVWQGSTMNTHDIGQVDVLLGPSSALYGSNASGGVVNMITRRGEAGMGINVELAYGSRNTFRPHIHFGDAVEASGGTFRYYVSYSGDFSDGYMMQPIGEMMRTHASSGYSNATEGQVTGAGMENNNYRYNYFATRLDWESDEGAYVSWSLNYANRYLHGGQPNFTAHDNAHQIITSVRAGTPISDWGTLKLAIGYQAFETYCNGTAGFSYDVDTGLLTLNTTPNTRRICVGTGNRKHMPIDLQLDIKPVENDIITVGFFYSRGWVNPQHAVGINPNNANYGRLTQEFRFNETQYSFYLQNSLTLLNDKLSILVGLRYDKWKYDNIYNMNWNPSAIPGASFDNIAFRSGVKYWVNDNIGLHVAYGTAYWQNPQNLFTSGITGQNQNQINYRLENHNLKPEKTWMAEFGIDFIKPEWGTEAYLTFYTGEIKDVQTSYTVYEDPLTNPKTVYTRTKNNGLVSIRGVEFSLSQELIPNILKISGSATFNHSRIKQDENPRYVGNKLSHSPEFVASVNLLFTKPDLFNMSVSYRHTDDRYYNNANDEYVHYHMRNVDVLDARIWRDWQLSDKVTMTTQISGTNLTDLSYEGLYTYMAPGFYVEGMISFTYHY
ncbi:MAG: TonB-dependent receptor [Deltaproteobacteria bacterium]|jgi:iron complex outermembrane receptor protein|nr:TonB-dependent receptor [Deltaproteobacteria bacterium]